MEVMPVLNISLVRDGVTSGITEVGKTIAVDELHKNIDSESITDDMLGTEYHTEVSANIELGVNVYNCDVVPIVISGDNVPGSKTSDEY